MSSDSANPEERKYLLEFYQLLKNKGASDAISISARGAGDPDFSEERKAFKTLVESQQWAGIYAAAGGIGAFITLRRLPKWIHSGLRKRAERKLMQSSGNPAQEALFAQMRARQQPEGQSFGSATSRPSLGRRMFRVVTFFMDFWISSMVSSWIFYNQSMKELREDNDGRGGIRIQDIPLLPGRSSLSESICKDCITLQDRIPYELRQSIKSRIQHMDNANSEDLFWRQYFSIASSCRRRLAYENKIRSERGLYPGTPVAIPPPGVPPDLPDEWSGEQDTFELDNGSDFLTPLSEDDVFNFVDDGFEEKK